MFSRDNFNKFQNLLEVILLAALWSPSFLFMKMGIRELSPITLIMFRLGLGAVCMFLFLKIKGISIRNQPRVLWGHAFILGMISMSIPFVLYCYSLRHIPTVLSALINGTNPLFTVLLAHIFLKEEPFTLNRGLGLMICAAGFGILLFPKITDGTFDSEALAIFLSALCPMLYAMGMIYVKKFVPETVPGGVMPALQMLTAMFYLVPLSFFVDNSLNSSLLDVSLNAWASVAGLSILGTVLAFLLYYRVIARQGATAMSTNTYIIPLFSVTLGILFLQEEVTLNFCVAGIVILFGVMVTNSVFSLPHFYHRHEPQAKEVQ